MASKKTPAKKKASAKKTPAKKTEAKVREEVMAAAPKSVMSRSNLSW